MTSLQCAGTETAKHIPQLEIKVQLLSCFADLSKRLAPICACSQPIQTEVVLLLNKNDFQGICECIKIVQILSVSLQKGQSRMVHSQMFCELQNI